ncbi:MAG: SDR family NAD(P)-dependent oxidoreductase [Syntrophaceae bacterium]|nr:SDR family NAD(P)-dependent oxidoreductase [Syntrophaceae bacterium]
MPGIKDFKDKVTVITGAGSGIGRATALAFVRKGADLIIVDNNPARLDEVAAEIKKIGARVLTRTVDVSKRFEVEDLAAFVLKERGRVDILFNNAGVSVGGSVADTSIEDWEWIFSINFWGVLYGVKAFLPIMIKQKYGHIVNTSSQMGLCATPGTPAYCTTKFAVVALGESMRAEVRKYNIGVSTICPGLIRTNIVAGGRMNIREDAVANRKTLEKIYANYGWLPDRVAKAVLKAVRRNKSVVPVGPAAWAAWFTKRISQRANDTYNLIIEKMLL